MIIALLPLPFRTQAGRATAQIAEALEYTLFSSSITLASSMAQQQH
jgi:hypothetical protein